MIPLRDHAPERNLRPFITWMLVAANISVFAYQTWLGVETPRALAAFMGSFAVIPERVTLALSGDASLVGGLLPVVTSMFLHGGWLHLLGNVWFLWIFGDNVEDQLGHRKFLLFYLICGVLAAVAQIVADPNSPVPMVGASGAIAGVMGAYLIQFPTARVTVLLPIFVFWTTVQLPAFVMLTAWLGVQVLSGTGGGSGGVAWWAHIGGFVAGAAFVLPRLVLQRRGRRR